MISDISSHPREYTFHFIFYKWTKIDQIIWYVRPRLLKRWKKYGQNKKNNIRISVAPFTSMV